MSDLIQDMLDDVKAAMQNPSSSIYLPKVIQSQTNPVIEPFQPTNVWTFTQAQDQGGILTNTMSTICNDYFGEVDDTNGVMCTTCAGGGFTFTFQDIVVTGLSNIGITGLTATSESPTITAQGTVVLGNTTGAGIPPALTINIGKWTLVVCCCQSLPGSSNCTSPCADLDPAIGTALLTFQQATGGGPWPTITLDFSMSINPSSQNDKVGVTVSNVSIAFTNLNLGTPQVVVQTFSKPDQQAWATAIAEAVGSVSFAAFLQTELNLQLQDPSVSSELQGVLETAANQYLQQNNLYPYGNAFERAF